VGTRAVPGRKGPIHRHYRAAVCGDGTILPIIESIGRRVLREIDPSSREGRLLLAAGKVALWSDGARRVRRAPVVEVLAQIDTDLKARLAEHPGDSRWRVHHLEMARAVRRVRRDLSH